MDLHFTVTSWQILRGGSGLSSCRVRINMQAQKTAAYLWHLKENQFPDRAIYICTLFPLKTEAHTAMQAKSWWHRAGRKVVIVAPVLLSILGTDQSSVCITVVYFLICLFVLMSRMGQKTNTHILFSSL